mgnify:CR=1 FL=1
MDAHVIDEIRDIGGRLDTMISYTIIKFIYKVCAGHISDIEIVLFGAITSIVYSLVLHAPKLSNASRVVCELVRKIALLVTSQAIIGVLGVGVNFSYDGVSAVHHVIQSVSAITCILMLTATIPEYCQRSELVQRSVTLLLFVYADSIGSLFTLVEGGTIPTLACILIYVALHKYGAGDHKRPSLAYLRRAMNMVCINFILQSLASLDRDSQSLQVQTVLYIVVLFVVDMVSHVSSMFQETRDYAMWKVSQQLFAMYASYQLDMVVSLAISVLVLATRAAWGGENTQLVFQLMVLVVVSVVLDAASVFLQSSSSVDKSVLLFVYVIIIHRMSSSLL